MHTKNLSDNLKRLGYDSRVDLYRQAAKEVIASHSGLGRYILEIFGPDLIGSLALAIDPYKQFRNSPRHVSLLTDGDKIVRTRRPRTIPGSFRTEHWTRTTRTESYMINPQGGIFSYVRTTPVVSVDTGTVNRGDQPTILGTIRDTTRRTRPPKYEEGEFELFIPRIEGRDYYQSWHTHDQYSFSDIGNGQRVNIDGWTTSRTTGAEFVCTDGSIQTFLEVMRIRALDQIQRNVYGMLDRVQPNHKTFNLFYQIAELRDLPRTLRGSLEIWRSFERLVGVDFYRQLLLSVRRWRNPELLKNYQRVLGPYTGFRFNELESLDKNASSAYLTFKFGWESMVQGLLQFLPSPARVANQINRLINSIGRDASFRTKKHWIDNEPSVPSLYGSTVLKDEDWDDLQIRISGQRITELRLVANFNIQFPLLDIPRLRHELFLERIGANPSPSDLYDLIPWTWLVDWFTGAGDYVHLMDSICHNKSLINTGFITYRETSEVTASVHRRLITDVIRSIDPAPTTYEHVKVREFERQGRFFITYQLRRSIPSLTNVKSFWDSNLNPSQTAIIGALLGTRNRSALRNSS